MSLQKMHYLDWLRGFVAVGKHLSFRKAAEELCLTQSAISKQVLALESLLGIKLFVRHPRSIDFTESGYALYLTARQSLDQIQVAVSNIQDSERSNIVKISTSVGFAGLWLLPRLASFYDEHPGVDIQVSADNRKISELSDHGIDLAVRYGSKKQMPEDAILLYEESVAPVTRFGTAEQDMDIDHVLSNSTWLEYQNPKTPWLTWSAYMEISGLGAIKPARTLYFNQYDQLIHAAIAGQGIALGRIPLVSNFLHQGLLRILSDRPIPLEGHGYWIVPPRHDLSAESLEVLEWLREQADGHQF